ncbi:TPA: hypothetical protein ACH3X1_010008 [Trebouxia sp. C0004]
MLGAQQHFLQMLNRHLSTENSGLYKSRRLLVKLALLYKVCLVLANDVFWAHMLRVAEHKVSMLHPVDLHLTAFQHACVILWDQLFCFYMFGSLLLKFYLAGSFNHE